MAKKKVLAVKFERYDASRVKGKVAHTRTGACTAKGACYHGRKGQR